MVLNLETTGYGLHKGNVGWWWVVCMPKDLQWGARHLRETCKVAVRSTWRPFSPIGLDQRVPRTMLKP